MATLYELADKYKKLIEYTNDALDSEDGNDEEFIQSMIDTLDSIDDEIELKVENIAKYLKSLNSEMEAYKNEKDRLAKKEKVTKNQIEGLKKYTQEMMVLAKKENIKSGVVSVRLQKNPPSVLIKDVSKIPSKYREKQEDKILTKEIAKAFKNNETVEGAELAPETKHIRFS